MTHVTKTAVLFVLLCVCSIGLVVTEHLTQHAPPAPRDLLAIVNAQIAAVRSADFESAYRYAAAGVQQRLTPAQFEAVVREQFSPAPRGSHVEYGPVMIDGDSALVQVYFVDPSGTVRAFVYNLAREEKGWKIDGVEEMKSYRSMRRIAGTHA